MKQYKETENSGKSENSAPSADAGEQGGTPVKLSPRTDFFAWLDNFWYYNKWKVLIIAFFAVIAVVSTVQLLSGTSPDTYAMYGGPRQIGSSESNMIASALADALSEDCSGDGVKNVSFAPLFIMSDEQIAEEYRKAQQSGTEITIFRNTITQNLNSFDQNILAGDASVCFVDPYLYERVAAAGGWQLLSEVFETVPDSAVNEYAIKLSDTDFGRYYNGVTSLPEDTLVCIRTVSTYSFLRSEKKTSEMYERSKQLMRSIVEFRIPEKEAAGE